MLPLSKCTIASKWDEGSPNISFFTIYIITPKHLSPGFLHFSSFYIEDHILYEPRMLQLGSGRKYKTPRSKTRGFIFHSSLQHELHVHTNTLCALSFTEATMRSQLFYSRMWHLLQDHKPFDQIHILLHISSYSIFSFSYSISDKNHCHSYYNSSLYPNYLFC